MHRSLATLAQRRSLATAVMKRATPRRLPPTNRLQTVRPIVTITKTKAGSDTIQPQNNSNSYNAGSVKIDHSTSDMNIENNDIIITDSCWKRIIYLANKKKQSPDSLYLRLFVDAGGCSGFTYKFEIEDASELDDEEDVVWHGPQDTRVVIDKASLDLLKGSTIDYVQEMIKSSFEVRDNPQSESACGCGSSFAVKKFSSNPALD